MWFFSACMHYERIHLICLVDTSITIYLWWEHLILLPQGISIIQYSVINYSCSELIHCVAKFVPCCKSSINISCTINPVSPNGHILHDYSVKKVQEFDIDMMWAYNPCYFIAYVHFHNHYHIQDTEFFHYYQDDFFLYFLTCSLFAISIICSRFKNVIY